MKKTGFLGMFLVVCCLWITSCSREELVIEQPEGKQAQEAEEAELETESGEQKSAMARGAKPEQRAERRRQRNLDRRKRGGENARSLQAERKCQSF